MNKRPKELKNGDPNEGHYLYMPKLATFRTSNNYGTYLCRWPFQDCFKRRRKFIQPVVDSLWKKWMHDFFPYLIVWQKWHTNVRNVKVCDVVLIQDSNAIRGHGKLAQVTKDKSGKDDNIRDVELRFKVQESESTDNGQVDSRRHACISVHRIVIILPANERTKWIVLYGVYRVRYSSNSDRFGYFFCWRIKRTLN